MSDTHCPCGSGRAFELCCEPYLLGRLPAPTAEALMRSRYTAYALCSIDYLYKTSGKRVRKEFDAEGSKRWAEAAEWSGLEVLAIEGDTLVLAAGQGAVALAEVQPEGRARQTGRDFANGRHLAPGHRLPAPHRSELRPAARQES